MHTVSGELAFEPASVEQACIASASAACFVAASSAFVEPSSCATVHRTRPFPAVASSGKAFPDSSLWSEEM